VEEYPAVVFQINNNNETSVNAEQFLTKKKYNDDLNKFLLPILDNKKALKMKKYGKKVKSYTQVLGLNLSYNKNEKDDNKQSTNKVKETNNKNERKKEIISKDKEIEHLKGVITTLQFQVQQLNLMLKVICQKTLMENKEKHVLNEKLQKIEQQNIQVEEEEEEIEVVNQMKGTTQEKERNNQGVNNSNFNLNKSSKVSVNDKVRTLAQYIDVELENSGQNKLCKHSRKRFRWEIGTKSS